MYGFLYNNKYIEVIIYAIFLLGIMLYNVFTLYKSDWHSPPVKLLVAGLCLSVADIAWMILYSVDSFSAPIAYFVFFVNSLCSMTVAMYGLMLIADKLYGWPENKSIPEWLRLFPLIVCSLNYLFFTSNIQAQSLEEVMNAYAKPIRTAYVIAFCSTLASIVLSTAVVKKSRGRDEELYQKAKDYLYYGIIATVFTLYQVFFFDVNRQFFSMGISCALCYLTIRRSTNILVSEEKNKSIIETELNTAAKIQLSALPNKFPAFDSHQEIVINAAMHTAREVGGDFYDFFEIGENRVCFVIADVSEKGIPAAMFMMRAKTVIESSSGFNASTSEIFNQSNEMLCEDNSEKMFATAWIGILNTDSLIMQYTNAGHNYPYISKAGREFIPLNDIHGLFLGGLPGTIYKQSEIQLEPGDKLFLYTDGLIEAHNKEDELYTSKKLAYNLNHFNVKDDSELLVKLKESVDNFADGTPQFDDITMMIVNIGQKEK